MGQPEELENGCFGYPSYDDDYGTLRGRLHPTNTSLSPIPGRHD